MQREIPLPPLNLPIIPRCFFFVFFSSCSCSCSSSSAFEHGSAPTSQSGGLDEGCGLHHVLHVTPQLFMRRCSNGATAAFLLRRGGRNVEHVLGTAVLSAMGSSHYVQDCGPLCYGQFSLCASPSWHKCSRLLSCRCSSLVLIFARRPMVCRF